MIRRFALAALLLFAAAGGPAAQEAAGSAVQETTGSAPTGKELDKLTDQVASELRCPVCRSLSVRDSQAELAREVEGVIRERLAAGESPEEVKAYFVSKYGEWILLKPPKRGFTLLVWVLPLLALALGGALLVVILRRWLEAPVDGEP
jgi:cytochrome c-type biogenesis protein CcmH